MLCINVCPAQLSLALAPPVVDPTAIVPGLLPSDKDDVIPSSKRLGAESGGIPLPLGVGGPVRFVSAERYALIVGAWPCTHL